jgi:hypothetical protein
MAPGGLDDERKSEIFYDGIENGSRAELAKGRLRHRDARRRADAGANGELLGDGLVERQSTRRSP